MTCKPRIFRVSMKKRCAGQVLLLSRNVPTSCPSPPISMDLCLRASPRRYVLDFFPLPLPRSLSLHQKVYSASVLAVLRRFGYDVENLNGPKVLSLFNVMTMERNAHDSCHSSKRSNKPDLFDRLELWLEATVNVTST